MANKEMKINVINQWLRTCTTWSYYVYGSIPMQKFDNACRTYAGNITYDSVIGMIDTTVFGSGKKGIIFTEDGVYYSTNQGGKYFSYKKPLEFEGWFEYNCVALNEMIEKLKNIELYGSEKAPSGWDILGGIIGGVADIISEISNGSNNIQQEQQVKQIEAEDENPEFAVFGIFPMFAKIAKANGVIKKEHIDNVEEIIEDIFGDEEEFKKVAIETFREAKNSDDSFEYYCNIYYEGTKNMEDVEDGYIGLIANLYRVVAINGSITSEEDRLIQFAVNKFNIDKNIAEEIREEFIDSNLHKYFEVLECSNGDSFEVIRSKYKKLASEYHPDVIASKNLPQYLVDYSNQKFQELQEAYDYLRKIYN